MDAASPRSWLVLIACIIVAMLNEISGAVLSLAMPETVRDIGATPAVAQLILLLGKLSLGALLLVGGALGDHFGRKQMILAGVAGVIAASILSAVAPSAWLLAAGRTLDGIGNALIGPLALAVCVLSFPSSMRARIVGLFLGLTSFGVLAGPLLAGFLIQLGSWRTGFIAPLALALLSGAAIALLVPGTRPDHRETPLDLGGMTFCAIGLTCLVLGFVLAANRGLLASRPLILIVIGVACLAAFAWWELHRAAEPLIDRRLLTSRQILAGLAAMLLMSLVLNGAALPFLYYEQRVEGSSPVAAVLRLAPLIVAALLMAPLAGRLVGRFGRKAVMIAGLLLVIAGAGIFTLVSAEAPYPLRLPLLILVGAGVMAVITPAADLVMASTNAERSGSAAALTAAVIQVGGAIGIGVITAAFVDTAKQSFLDQAMALGIAPEQANDFLRNLRLAVQGAALHEVPRLPEATLQLHTDLVAAYAHAVALGVDRGFAFAALLALVCIPILLLGARGSNRMSS